MDNNGNHTLNVALIDSLMLAMHIILVSLIIERITSTLAKLIQRVDRPKCLIVGHYWHLFFQINIAFGRVF
jgi:hypothetical protein